MEYNLCAAGDCKSIGPVQRTPALKRPTGAGRQHPPTFAGGRYRRRTDAVTLVRAKRAGVVAMRVLLSMFVVLLMGAASAHAQVYHGNDTGGIISWSCENEAAAPQIAARYCARWDKY